MTSQQTQERTVESIMAYFKDNTGLLANPGLRPQIRDEVKALYNAMQHLRQRHQMKDAPLRQYIIRRYIASISGVLQIYPGCQLTNDYEPSRRPWFRQALQQPGRLVTTAPYLDAGGAGYIVTIAHSILEGKSHALHSLEHDRPVAVVALDLPYNYYYKLLLETMPLCKLLHIKCLLFEHEGYLVAHPSMLESSSMQRNQRRPYEHLTHIESYLANDILNHKSLVRKYACANYLNRTLQRNYRFNTSLHEVLTNVVHGERTKYAIALIPGTNMFAAVLNSSCDGGAFCPCSTINRMCMNCKRMDQMDCECPCECPIADLASNYTLQYAYCPSASEYFLALPATNTAFQGSLLPVCTNINCDVYGTQLKCLAVMGCEWCQQDLEGNIFVAPFCTAQASCFNGVLASVTAYGELDDVGIAARGYNPGQKQNSYSAFGPVGGAIIVLGIVIGFAIYCYRQNLEAHSADQFYMDSMQEENYGLPLSRFNFDDCQAHDDPPGGNNCDYAGAAQRNHLINAADISPYHMSSGSSYRRPPNGESDHGYSTMTPHEDSSEHQCFTLAEPLLLNDHHHHRYSKSDTMSVSTSISSPTNRQQQQLPATHGKPYLSPTKRPQVTPLISPARGVYAQTQLPHEMQDQLSSGPQYILAPVTVHRHMEPTES